MSEVNDRAMLQLYRDEVRKIATTLGLDDFDEFKDIREAIRELQAQLDRSAVCNVVYLIDTLSAALRVDATSNGLTELVQAAAEKLNELRPHHLVAVDELQAQLDRAKDENICWAEGVAAAEEEAAKAIAATDGLWDCVCAPEPGAMHSQDCPAYLRQSVENIVTANHHLREQLDRATSERAGLQDERTELKVLRDYLLKAHGRAPYAEIEDDNEGPAKFAIGLMNRRAVQLQSMSARFMADDGDGEREEFSTLAEAHEWAEEQVARYARDAVLDGEWPGEVNDVAVWQVIESTREFDAGDGSDFVLEPHTPKPAEPRPVDDAAFREVVIAQAGKLMECACSGDAFELDVIIDAIVDARPSQEPRPMSEAPRDGTAILVRGSMGWEVTRWDADGWGCRACGGEYGVGQLEAIEWMPLPVSGDEETTAAGGSGEGE